MNELENRIMELEIQIALQNDLIDSLNDTISRMRETLDLQQAQLRLIYQKMDQTQYNEVDKPYSLIEEIPPHY